METRARVEERRYLNTVDLPHFHSHVEAWVETRFRRERPIESVPSFFRISSFYISTRGVEGLAFVGI